MDTELLEKTTLPSGWEMKRDKSLYFAKHLPSKKTTLKYGTEREAINAAIAMESNADYIKVEGKPFTQVSELATIAGTAQQSLFDYEQLEERHRVPIQRATTEIREFMRRTVVNCIKIGERLNDVRNRFPTADAFTAWFKAEFNGSQRMMYNLMKLHERLGDVDTATLENVGLSTLYELVADATPEDARQAVLQIAGDGHKVTSEMAKTIITETKQAERSRQTSLLDAPTEAELLAGDDDDIPVCLCGHKADRHANMNCDDCTCEQYEEAEAGEDAVSIHKKITSPVKLDTRPFCLCEHAQEDHEEGVSNCKFCNCDCFQSERADHSNVETLIEQTETTTITENVPAVSLHKPVGSAPPSASLKGEADIEFEKVTVRIVLTIYPRKGKEERKVLIQGDANSGTPQFEYADWSQVEDVFVNHKLGAALLSVKNSLAAKAKPVKKAAPSKPSPPAAKPPAKPAKKASKKTVTKTVTKVKTPAKKAATKGKK